MKKVYIVFPAMLMMLIACSREQMPSTLTSAQLDQAREMEEQVQGARRWNDSLRGAGGNRSRALYCDSMYHAHENRFRDCHDRYDHNSTAADHFHNGAGAMMMHNGGNGMMGSCNCCANGGHRANVHHELNSLQQAHRLCHP